MSTDERLSLFWVRVSGLGLSVHEVALLSFLFNAWRESGFVERFAVDNEAVMQALSICKPTLIKTRKDLMERGVLFYISGTGRKQPSYVLDEERVKVLCEERERVQEQEREDERARQEQIKVQTKEVKGVKPKPRSTTQRRSKPRQLGFFKEKDVEKRKTSCREYMPPSFEDVLLAFYGYGKGEEEAKAFYIYYEAQGWVTGTGQRIRNVDSMVNRWITNNHEKKGVKENGIEREELARARRNEEVRRYVYDYFKDDESGCG